MLAWVYARREGANREDARYRASALPCREVQPAKETNVNWQWESEMAPIRVLLVDDHALARRGIRAVLSSNANLDVVCEAADGEEAVNKAEELHPAIILLDITLPGISGIQAARRIRASSPESRIIFLSQHDSIQIAKDALSVGAQGYVVKSDAGRDLLTAIEAVHEGRTFISRTLVARGWNSKKNDLPTGNLS
jgi:DNA-binding NarL/FixJ family response regulator